MSDKNEYIPLVGKQKFKDIEIAIALIQHKL